MVLPTLRVNILTSIDLYGPSPSEVPRSLVMPKPTKSSRLSIIVRAPFAVIHTEVQLVSVESTHGSLRKEFQEMKGSVHFQNGSISSEHMCTKATMLFSGTGYKTTSPQMMQLNNKGYFSVDLLY